MNGYILAYAGLVWLIFGLFQIAFLKTWYPLKFLNILIALIGGVILEFLLRK